jgi:hypothetical protein
MTQASHRVLARKEILKALEVSSIQGKGLGYNDLFKRVKRIVKSRPTFEKYLSDLLHDHIIEKRRDPQDRRAVRIIANPETLRRQLIFLDGLTKIQEIAAAPTPSYIDWRKQEEALFRGKTQVSETEMNQLFSHPYIIHRDLVTKMVRTAYSMFIKIEEPNLSKFSGWKSPLDIYLRVVDSGIMILRRERVLQFDEGESRLEAILQAAQRNPTLAKLLQQEIPDFKILSPRAS